MKITLKKLDPGQINEKKYEAKVVKEGTRYASRRQPGNRSSSTLGRETSNVTTVLHKTGAVDQPSCKISSYKVPSRKKKANAKCHRVV